MHLVSVVTRQGRGYFRDRAHQDKLQRFAAGTGNRQLQQALQAGVAFHHAGMEASERAQVEELFLEKDIVVRTGRESGAMHGTRPCMSAQSLNAKTA